jgi:hypothetical protein
MGHYEHECKKEQNDPDIITTTMSTSDINNIVSSGHGSTICATMTEQTNSQQPQTPHQIWYFEPTTRNSRTIGARPRQNFPDGYADGAHPWINVFNHTTSCRSQRPPDRHHDWFWHWKYSPIVYSSKFQIYIGSVHGAMCSLYPKGPIVRFLFVLRTTSSYS